MPADVNQFVYVVATLDTKRDEIEFVVACLNRVGIATKLVDVSTQAISEIPSAVSIASCVRSHSSAQLSALDRGVAIELMSKTLKDYLKGECDAERVGGVIGIGGSGGTALITHAMRALPIGLPKVMISTVASGNTAPYVDCNDITMMFSVVDVAGLNNVSRKVLSNGAHAIAGMVQHQVAETKSNQSVGMTMFGVTTAGVTQVRKSLEQRGYECLVFHATGTGGRAMERLVESGLIHGVIDMTTTEVADEVVGGVFACGPERFDRILAAKVPYVVSLGALDMVNFGAIDTVPPQFRDRKLHVHNSQVTLMRTTPEENVLMGKWIAQKLNRSMAPLTMLIPLNGVSALDVQGGAFYDPVANKALFESLKTHLQQTDDRRILELRYHINEQSFAEAVLREYHTLADGKSK